MGHTKGSETHQANFTAVLECTGNGIEHAVDNVKRNMEIIAADSVDEMLRRTLVTEPQRIEWNEPDELESVPAAKDEGERSGVVTH